MTCCFLATPLSPNNRSISLNFRHHHQPLVDRGSLAGVKPPSRPASPAAIEAEHAHMIEVSAQFVGEVRFDLIDEIAAAYGRAFAMSNRADE
jgi:hypothetical protein